MEKILIVGLHGFLGKGEDWKPLCEAIRKEAYDVQLEFWCPSLLSPNSKLNPEHSFKKLSQKLLSEIKNFEYDKCVLLGYSMGGRLALHSFVNHPSEFSAAIFLSTNPILESQNTVAARLETDLKWSKKFATEAWKGLIEEWNRQPIFSGELSHPTRSEENYSRKFLSLALKNWSLAKHEIGLAELQKIKQPNLWFVGERDSKYLAIIKLMEQKGIPAEFFIVHDRAHRLGFSANKEIVEKTHQFLKNL